MELDGNPSQKGSAFIWVMADSYMKGESGTEREDENGTQMERWIKKWFKNVFFK